MTGNASSRAFPLVLRGFVVVTFGEAGPAIGSVPVGAVGVTGDADGIGESLVRD